MHISLWQIIVQTMPGTYLLPGYIVLNKLCKCHPKQHQMECEVGYTVASPKTYQTCLRKQMYIHLHLHITTYSILLHFITHAIYTEHNTHTYIHTHIPSGTQEGDISSALTSACRLDDVKLLMVIYTPQPNIT